MHALVHCRALNRDASSPPLTHIHTLTSHLLRWPRTVGQISPFSFKPLLSGYFFYHCNKKQNQDCHLSLSVPGLQLCSTPDTMGTHGDAHSPQRAQETETEAVPGSLPYHFPPVQALTVGDASLIQSRSSTQSDPEMRFLSRLGTSQPNQDTRAINTTSTKSTVW